MPYREETYKRDFKDAINKGFDLAVDEILPYARLMPVGKLRKFDRVYDYNDHMFKDIGYYRVNALKGKLGVQSPFGKVPERSRCEN